MTVKRKITDQELKDISNLIFDIYGKAGGISSHEYPQWIKNRIKRIVEQSAKLVNEIKDRRGIMPDEMIEFIKEHQDEKRNKNE